MRSYRKEFNENSTVDVSDGYQDNIHIVIVSNKFSGKSENEKQDMLWNVIEASDLSDIKNVTDEIDQTSSYTDNYAVDLFLLSPCGSNGTPWEKNNIMIYRFI